MQFQAPNLPLLSLFLWFSLKKFTYNKKGKSRKNLALIGILWYSSIVSKGFFRRVDFAVRSFWLVKIQKSTAWTFFKKGGIGLKKVTELTAELAAPVIAAQGCELWDVEYVKEAGTWYLRLYIDKEGGVSIDDCEAISRRVSDLLDEADPIEGSYTFEVSSAGAERPLKRASDFARFLGSPVTVRLYKNQGRAQGICRRSGRL